jgi:hypothetical protein
MATWGDIRTDIRYRLKDTSTTRYKWSDVELLMYARDAMRNFSTRFPQRLEEEISVLSGTADYALPTDTVRVDLVITPERVLREIELQPGRLIATRPTAANRIRYNSTDLTQRVYGFTVRAGTLRLFPTPETDFTAVVRLDTLYAEPVDEDSEITIPSIAHVALKYLICAYAVERDELADSSLRRWATKEDGGTNRDDNPLRPMARDFYRRYETEIRWLRDTEHFALV